MPRHVAVVFAPDYSAELGKLAFHTPVWIAETPENRGAAARAWQESVEWPHISVTLFRQPAGEPSRDDWRTLVEQISFERPVDGIDVIGTPLSPIALDALREAGFAKFEETAEGFRARRG
ncbi:MAG TPA: hypothetical protein VNA69_17850 [Thermoanaerobaculia bacterium]|nr:hypothetical protein [Thermoanaerobaculia bacterium]